jgi:DNA-binding GntR family transcriptional regulator
MTEKSENIVRVTQAMIDEAKARITPEFLAELDAITDEDIAAQIAADPDLAPELDDEWFANARLVIPLKMFAAE